MGERNPLMECLGRYSKSNLVLMLYDRQHALAERIWHLAGRRRQRTMIAEDSNCREFIERVRNSFYDGLLFRQVENLSRANHLYLMEALIRMNPVLRGRIIFTTADFERVDAGLLMQVCKIRFRVPVSEEVLNDTDYFDYEAKQLAVGKYF